MKKGLFLYGINCTVAIWDEVKDAFLDMDAIFVAYPHEITQNAHQISDITNWVYETYGNDRFDQHSYEMREMSSNPMVNTNFA